MLTDEVDLPRGRTLMRQGDRGEELFVIVSGSASVDRDGTRLREAGAGEVLGEIALLDGGPRTATVTLTAPSMLLVVGRRDFLALMDEFPEVRLRILETVAARLRTLDRGGVH